MLGQTGQIVEERPPARTEAVPMPAPCLRYMHWYQEPECPDNCRGLQDDGSCLAELMIDALHRDCYVTCEMDREGRWHATGTKPL